MPPPIFGVPRSGSVLIPCSFPFGVGRVGGNIRSVLSSCVSICAPGRFPWRPSALMRLSGNVVQEVGSIASLHLSGALETTWL